MAWWTIRRGLLQQVPAARLFRFACEERCHARFCRAYRSTGPWWWQFPTCYRDDCARGLDGRGRFSSAANFFETASACEPNAARVPTAPPNCSTRQRVCVSTKRSRCRCKASSHPANFMPSVVGTACCSHVRPTMGVAAVFVSEFRQLVRQSSFLVSRDQLKCFAQLQNEAGIDGVLTGGAPMHEICRVFVIGRNQCLSCFTRGIARFPAIAEASANFS